MKPPSNGSQSKARKIWMLVILILAVAVGSLGILYWSPKTTAQAKATASSTLKTKQVRKGTITLMASGSATVIASQESNLAFSVSGTVATLNAAVGDLVKKGDVLAQLDNLDELQANINSAGQDLQAAQQDLATLKSNAASNLAKAQLKVIAAQKAVDDAKASAVQKDMVRCDQDTKDALYQKYQKALKALDALGDGGGSNSYYLSTILPQKQLVDQAKGAYDACAGYTGYQVTNSQGKLTIAQAELKQAQDNLETLSQNNGLDPVELAAAENKVATAQETLDSDKEDLAGATLTAPFDGTILTVAGKAGDTIEVTSTKLPSTFITIADLAHPLVEFTVDESDMDLVAKGEAVKVIFTGYSDRTFTGTVKRVDPALSSSSDASGVTGLIELDLSQEKYIPVFPKDLPGSVEIIHASAENVLLVPREALHDQSDGTYGVYVLGADGQPTLRTVKVGLSDVASAEIQSGLSLGESVVTSSIK